MGESLVPVSVAPVPAGAGTVEPHVVAEQQLAVESADAQIFAAR